MNWKAGPTAGAVLVVAAFVVGFVPQYRRAANLNDELAAAQQQLNSEREKSNMEKAGLLIGYIYLETNLKNYGLAGQSAPKFFDKVQAMGGRTTDPNWQALIPAIGARRDQVVSGLAKGDPATLAAVQDIFQRMLDATQAEWK
ncbi:MAG TPA: hypothetical protein VGF16_07000 [Bryobacteraceae bacterium]